jgi:hypothetical protein
MAIRAVAGAPESSWLVWFGHVFSIFEVFLCASSFLRPHFFVVAVRDSSSSGHTFLGVNLQKWVFKNVFC